MDGFILSAVPGPPTNLQMSASKTNSISVSWMPPTGISPAEISHYLVNVELKDSFDKRVMITTWA